MRNRATKKQSRARPVRTAGKKPVCFVFPAVLCIVISGCSRQESVVAEFGSYRLSLDEFKLTYLDLIKQPNMFDSRTQREKFLDEMISRRILAGEAKKRGMENERLKMRVDAYRDKCIRDAHFQKVIKPSIHIEEELVEEVFTFTQEERYVRRLFALTARQADSLTGKLKNGVPFDDLIRNTPEQAGNEGGDPGWVRWEEMEYDMAMTVFRLPLHEYSGPVRSQQGYHILQVTDFRKRPLYTRQEYEINRDKTRKLLEQKIGDRIALDTIGNMMNKVSIQVRPQTLKRVGDHLETVLKREPSEWDQMKDLQLSDPEISGIERGLHDIRNETLADIDGDPLTVEDFIAGLAYVPYDAIYSSYKSALDYVFRDYVITREGRTMDLDRTPEVRTKTSLYAEHLLSLSLKRKLVREVSVNETEVRLYYDSHPEDILHRALYDSVRLILEDRILTKKRMDIIPEYVRSLVPASRIRKYPERIHAYYDSLINRKKAGSG